MTAFRDNRGHRRFELEIDGHTAFIAYRRRPDGITLVHTEVPTELGGRGVASDLARRVLDALRAEGARVAVTCPFLQAWLQRHPEYSDLLATPAEF